MKKQNIILAGFLLLLAVIFTSCSSTIDIAKRQFNNGYYVHVNSHKHQPENVVATTKKEDAIITGSADPEPTVVAATASEPVVKNDIMSKDNSIASSIENKQPVAVKKRSNKVVVNTQPAATENYNPEFRKQSFMQRKLGRMAERAKLRGTAPGIVLIILCIFLPPVAVGIVNDWGGKFWLDLLLTFLFYFPGMIYAFIVCFS